MLFFFNCLVLLLLLICVLSYDHLSKLLTKILNERPNDAVDILEDLSKQQKRERFVNQVDTLLDKPDKSTESKLADIQKGLFMVTIGFY